MMRFQRFWQVLIIATLFVLLLATLQSVLQRNIFARDLAQDFFARDVPLPWRANSADWWISTCNSSASSVEPATYLQIIAAIANGSCRSATTALTSINEAHDLSSPVPVEQVVLAYTLSSMTDWDTAAQHYPVTKIPVGNWADRRYWGNVLNRARQSNSALWQQSESLLNIYLPDSSENLYLYYLDANRLDDAHGELRRLAYAQAPTINSSYHDELLAAFTKDHNVESDEAQFTTIERDSAQPSLMLDYQHGDWILWGVDIERKQNYDGSFALLTTYWHTLQATQTIYVQTEIIQNRLANGGFEWDTAASNVRPSGFEAIYGDRHPFPYEIRLDQMNHYFCMNNQLPEDSSGIQARADISQLDHGSILLYGAEFFTEEAGKAIIGIKTSSVSNELVEQQSAAINAQSSTWQQALGITTIPSTTSTLTMQAIQFMTEGTVCVDNLFAYMSLPPSSTSSR